MKWYSVFLYLLLPAFFFSCNAPQKKRVAKVLEEGVSQALAEKRAQNISKVVYKLHFVIPGNKSVPLTGEMEMAFDVKDPAKEVILDFQQKKSAFKILYVNGKKSDKYRIENRHIIIEPGTLKTGRNILGMEFTPSDLSLNRNSDYMYTLFVPDRASTAFPCFDQPDIKGQFILALDVPDGWEAVSNGPLVSKKPVKKQQRFTFAQTKPMSTYLFAFAAGKFEKISKTIEGHAVTFYYRETDKQKIKKNLDDILLLQADAVTWMEQYTKMVYPFQKFAFVAIPSFQYSGMEHPGAVFYRAGKLFLDPSPTLTQKLNRAKLIAHETAHMWFGDLVTMKWFDDVWLKEVFANFLADKMANPSFPTLNHKLLFVTDHFPKAYAVDRTKGTHPIKQKLENLKMAGTLYGPIIYHKAPIVMQKLEKMMGYEQFRKGLTEYLRGFAYSNADWDDLIEIMDKHSDKDLKKWSDAWVKEAGMPVYKTTQVMDEMYIDQFDSQGKTRIWPQTVDLFFVKDGKYREDSFYDDQRQYIEPMRDQPDFIFLNEKGNLYGYQVFDENSRAFIMGRNMFGMPPVTRASVYINQWEDMLNFNTWPIDLRSIYPYYIKTEKSEPNINLLLGYYRELFWRYSLPAERDSIAPKMEALLWKKMNEAKTQSLKSSYFKTYVNTAVTPAAVKRLVDIWNQKTTIKGLQLTENDFIDLACELAVRKETPAGKFIPDDLLQQQLNRIKNPDRKKEMAFILPALNNNPGVRAEFFENLKLPENREHEPWVLKAVHYMNHPLVAVHSEKFVLPAMEMLDEIQQTGDIFFPKDWLTETFYGHNTVRVAKEIKEFLDKDHDMNPTLRSKLAQAADPVFRSAKILYSDNEYFNEE